MKTLLALSLLALCTFALQDTKQAAPRLEQHEWLLQLVGEWELTSEAVMEPGGAPTNWESRESIRSIGGLWVVSEGSADNGGEPFTSLMTLGYDPGKGSFVGSWIDTMAPTMWNYVGHLDEARRTLTLEAEGPSVTDPSVTARYRDTIELLSADRRKTTSSMLADDGTWTTFMTGEARRVK